MVKFSPASGEGHKLGFYSNNLNQNIMREIKFRGQRTNGEGWLFGDLSHHNEQALIIPKWEYPNQWDDADMNVNPETVGQFTGLKDKNGVDIYEGDIVKIFYNQNSENYAGNNFNYTEHTCIVEFSEYSSSFVLRNITEKYKGKHNFTTIKFDHRRLQRDRIIGNIHSNPELLNK